MTQKFVKFEFVPSKNGYSLTHVSCAIYRINLRALILTEVHFWVVVRTQLSRISLTRN